MARTSRLKSSSCIELTKFAALGLCVRIWNNRLLSCDGITVYPVSFLIDYRRIQGCLHAVAYIVLVFVFRLGALSMQRDRVVPGIPGRSVFHVRPVRGNVI